MNDENLRRLTTKEAREIGAKGGSSPKRKQTLDAKRVMRKILLAAPTITPEMAASLKKKGIDTGDDAELATNIGLLGAIVLNKALSGDLNAVKMALEMGGQAVTMRDQIDKDRIELERAKLKAETEAPEAAEDDGFLDAIAQGCAEAWTLADEPANIHDSDDETGV